MRRKDIILEKQLHKIISAGRAGLVLDRKHVQTPPVGPPGTHCVRGH